jgi:hypothetical protein
VYLGVIFHEDLPNPCVEAPALDQVTLVLAAIMIHGNQSVPRIAHECELVVVVPLALPDGPYDGWLEVMLAYGLPEGTLDALSGALGYVDMNGFVFVQYHGYLSSAAYSFSGLNLLMIVIPCLKGRSLEHLEGSMCKQSGL